MIRCKSATGTKHPIKWGSVSLSFDLFEGQPSRNMVKVEVDLKCSLEETCVLHSPVLKAIMCMEENSKYRDVILIQ